MNRTAKLAFHAVYAPNTGVGGGTGEDDHQDDALDQQQDDSQDQSQDQGQADDSADTQTQAAAVTPADIEAWIKENRPDLLQRQDQQDTQQQDDDDWDKDTVDKAVTKSRQVTETAFLTRIQLANSAEAEVRAEFPNLPEADVLKIKNAFFDPGVPAESLAAAYKAGQHKNLGKQYMYDAVQSGKVGGIRPPGKSPVGGDHYQGMDKKERDAYDKYIAAFGRAYADEHGRIDHKKARARFEEGKQSA